MPPPPEVFASRLFLGPALRAQPDRRLVTLVREGYEAGFEEIVRRYGRPLARYAASIVGSRSEDVTQDAFSKALTAMRRDDNEIDLRPWLYRIVRNTALNDLRDRPPTAEILEEAIAARRGTAAEVEEREELRELIDRLQALPERQRAAIVMRELEGLSHEEIAAALGLSGGAARQVIFRAREALRSGAGLLVPLPLVRLLLEYGQEATASAGAGAGLLAAGGAAGGAGTALKAGAVAVIIAGSVGTGLALQQNHGREGTADAAVIEGGRQSDGASVAAHPSAGSSPGAKAGGESGGGGGERSGDGSGAAGSQGRGGSGNTNEIRPGAHSGPPGSGGGGGGSGGTGPGGSGSGGSRNSGPGSGGSISAPVGGEHAESGDRHGGSTDGSDDSAGPSGSSGGGSDDNSGPGSGISGGSDGTDSHSGSGSDGTDGGSATTEPAPETDGSTGSSDGSGIGSSDGSSSDVVSGSELSRSGPDGGGGSPPPPSS